LKTLVATVLVFLMCWTPYTIVVLAMPKTVSPLLKKVKNILHLAVKINKCRKFESNFGAWPKELKRHFWITMITLS